MNNNHAQSGCAAGPREGGKTSDPGSNGTHIARPGRTGQARSRPDNHQVPETRASHGSVRTDPATWRTGSTRSIGFAFPAVSVTLYRPAST